MKFISDLITALLIEMFLESKLTRLQRKSFWNYRTRKGTYIKTFPLHESRKILKENQHKIIVPEIHMHPTNDILIELLKYGTSVKRLSPLRFNPK